MSQNKSTSTINNSAGNKDLSCLRCRKKKAKCSKTRPACTRCARSNQPCEYPDAPPNLTDLSQKVLSLYDTLRELEDKFMLQYATQEQEQEITAKTGEKRRRQSSSSSNNSINSKSPLDDMPSIESLSLLNPIIKRPRRQNQEQQQQQQQQNESSPLPGNWSMSLTSHGLSLHAVARNMIEFSSFAKDFSQQLRNNDPENKLTKSWEWYEEDPIGDEYDDDPLDEDEYLVTVPVYPLSSLLDYHHNDNNNNFVVNNNKNTISNTINNVNDNDDDEEEEDEDTPYYNRIRPLLDDLINYLRQTYNILSMDQFPIHLYHIITLLQQLQPFIPFDQKSFSTNKHENPIQLVCTTTAYAASIQLLSPTHQPSQSTQLVNDCIHYASSMLIELVFQQQQQQQQENINPPSLPIVSCAALLSWMGKSEMAHLATRTMYGSDDWDETNDQWRHLAASLLYHQVYSMAFSSSCNKKSHYEIIGEAEIWLLRSAKQLSQQKQTEKTNTSSPLHYFYGTTLGLETELVCLLKQVFGLFYDMENQNENKKIRKVDVDDVLKLVQNIEEWEHALPKWVQWSTSFNSTETRWLKLKMHIHLIHNIVKILLFRPFSIEPFQQEGGHEKMGDGLEDQVQLNGNDLLQTHTRTTFLDLSLAAADRATLCIRHLHDNTNHKMDNNEDAWVRAGDCLAKDVIRRVKEAFPCDDELFIIIQGIENRFIEKEVIKPSSLPL